MAQRLTEAIPAERNIVSEKITAIVLIIEDATRSDPLVHRNAGGGQFKRRRSQLYNTFSIDCCKPYQSRKRKHNDIATSDRALEWQFEEGTFRNRQAKVFILARWS